MQFSTKATSVSGAAAALAVAGLIATALAMFAGHGNDHKAYGQCVVECTTPPDLDPAQPNTVAFGGVSA